MNEMNVTIEDGQVGDVKAQRRYHPEDLLTVEECAAYMKCHLETIRRAYWANELRRMPFGARGVRIRFADLLDWIKRGARTKAA